MRFLAASALVLATIATPALAQSESDSSFAGFKVAGVAGWDHVGDGVDSADGVAYGVTFGYDYQSAGVLLGIEGEAALSSTKECAGGYCTEAGRDLYGGVRIGAPINDKVLAYVKTGYTNARAEETNNGNTLFHANLDGVRVGAGVEASVSGNMFVRGEYRYSNYEAGVERHQVLAGFGVRF